MAMSDIVGQRITALVTEIVNRNAPVGEGAIPTSDQVQTHFGVVERLLEESAADKDEAKAMILYLAMRYADTLRAYARQNGWDPLELLRREGLRQAE